MYQLSNGLVVTETTILNHNSTLWQEIRPDSVMEFVRNTVANRLATDGQSWSEIFSRHNSGTYNNQWMVLDWLKFTPGMEPAEGFLTVLEQLPQLIVSEDQTKWLHQHKYWGSYNRPFYREIFEHSNQTALVNSLGDHYSWNATARAVLLRQLQPSVRTLKDMQRVIRWNRFDSESIGMQGCKAFPSGSNALAERGDLTSPSSGCIPDIAHIDEGAIDAKIVRFSTHPQLSSLAQSGPTNDDQPAFDWRNSSFKHLSHVGMPDRWAFPWVSITW